MQVIALMGPLFTNHGLKANQDESDFLIEAALFRSVSKDGTPKSTVSCPTTYLVVGSVTETARASAPSSFKVTIRIFLSLKNARCSLTVVGSAPSGLSVHIE